MRFESLTDLTRLPWFALRDGRLVLADQTVPRAIDFHVHLALSYGPLGGVDLQASAPQTRWYLPHDRPFDLDIYANKNFSEEDLKNLRFDMGVCCVTPFGMRRTHTVANLLRDSAEHGVESSVLLAIEFPFSSRITRDWGKAIAGHPEMVLYGSVHPWTPNLKWALDRQLALGIRGLKLHPAVQMFPPDDPRALRLYRLCGERGVPIIFHCGPVDIELPIGRRMSQVRLYARGIEENPGTTFILGHSGALQMEEALALAVKHPNVWLELSSQSLPNVKTILAEADPARIVFGSDWPFYPQALVMAKVLIATEGKPELRRRVLRENAERLLKLRPGAPAV